MAKDIHVTVLYKKKEHIIICKQREFGEKVSEKMSIDMDDVLLYQKNHTIPISLNSIRDLMHLEMHDKEEGCRSLRSHLDPSLKLMDKIKDKLNKNSAFTGNERQSLLTWLEDYKSMISKKRKSINGDDDGSSSRSVCHKKVQVNPLCLKESFTQTDSVNNLNNVSTHAEDSEALAEEMRKLAADGEVSDERIKELMKATYSGRRNFIILQIPPVVVVKDRYPFLFKTSEVKNEMERLFYLGKCDEFLKNMEKYSRCLLSMCSPTDDILSRINDSKEKSHTQRQKTYAEIVGSVFALASFLEEQHFNFIHLNDRPHGSNTLYPYIDASSSSLKETFSDGKIYYIKVEGQQLCEASDFLEAILCLVASFFVFNISYPDSCRRTLIAFEKLYLIALDTEAHDIDEVTSQTIKLCEMKSKELNKKK